MNQKNYPQQLRITSICYFVLAAAEVLVLALSLPDLFTPESVAAAGGSMEVLKLVAYIVIALSAIKVIIEVILGAVGLKQAGGAKVGKGHITLAMVFAAFAIINLVPDVIGVFNGTVSVADICPGLGGLTVLFWYVAAAKAMYAEQAQ